MSVARPTIFIVALALIIFALGAENFMRAGHAQNITERDYAPDTQRAIGTHAALDANRSRPNSGRIVRAESLSERTPDSYERQDAARPAARKPVASTNASAEALIGAGT